MASKKEDPRIKNLRIKTGVLKRLIKEKAMYEGEVVQQKAKIEKMRKEGKDNYDIKKQGEVLQESENMIPDCQRRIGTAHSDLMSLMSEDWSEFIEDEQYKAAQQLLDENKDLEDS